MTPISIDSRRAFARVSKQLPVRIRMLDENEAQTLAERFTNEPTYTERVIADPKMRSTETNQWDRAALSSIIAQLDRLETAVARIAEALKVDVHDAGVWMEGHTVDLSGSGLGVHVSERIEQDAMLEVEMTLLGDPTIILRAVGRAVALVNSEGSEIPVGRFHLGIAFQTIHEDDRQALVRYTFRLQRELLRRRRELDESE